MRWAIFSATWICAWRRLRPVLAANPILGAAAVVAVAATPPACVFGGLRLADGFALAASDEGFVRALALALATTGLVAGAAFALLAPRPSVLGSELAAAPLTRRALVAATVVAPALGAGRGLAVVAGLLFVPLARASGSIVVICFAASACLGATAGEGFDLCVRRDPAGVVVISAVGAAWLAAGRDQAELGPGALVVAAFEDPGSRRAVGALLAALAAAGAYGWLIAAARPRSEVDAGGRVRAIGLPTSGAAALFVATLLRLARHPQLRLNGLAAVVVPLALSGAMWIALDVGGAVLVGFGVGLALTVAALFPAAARGLSADASWLLDVTPTGASVRAAAITCAGVAAAAAVVVAVAALPAPLVRADLVTYAQLEAAAAFVLGCAAFAGAVVPWRPDQVVQQLGSYGTLVAVAVLAWVLTSRLEPLAAALGASELTFGLVVGNAVLVAGLAGSAAAAR